MLHVDAEAGVLVLGGADIVDGSPVLVRRVGCWLLGDCMQTCNSCTAGRGKPYKKCMRAGLLPPCTAQLTHAGCEAVRAVL